MIDDKELRAKLAKMEALFRGTGSPGEKAAAAAAMDRLQGRLGGSDGDGDPEIEMKFSLPDMWSVRLFIFVCRKHGVHPYHYARQRRTTVMALVDATPTSNHAHRATLYFSANTAARTRRQGGSRTNPRQAPQCMTQ